MQIAKEFIINLSMPTRIPLRHCQVAPVVLAGHSIPGLCRHIGDHRSRSTRLQQQNTDVRVFRQSCGDNGTGTSGTDDNVVVVGVPLLTIRRIVVRQLSLQGNDGHGDQLSR